MPLITINPVEASNNVNKAQSTYADTLKKLAAGTRLANPSADAAGVAVSANLTAASAQLTSAGNNVQAVASFGQAVDGFYSTLQQGVTQLSVLAQQATNGTLNAADQANYATVFNTISQGLNTIANSANVGGTPVFQNGSVTTTVDNQGTTASLNLTSAGTPANTGINALNISTQAGAQAALPVLDAALSTISGIRASTNASVSVFTFYNTNIQTENVNVQAANARISNLDVANESTKNAQAGIQVQSSISVLAQANLTASNVNSLLISGISNHK